VARTVKEFVKHNKRIVPVITLPDLASAIPLADTLSSCGFQVLEITLRTEWALAAIAQLKQERPGLLIGAGTVKNETQLLQSIDAGAEFIVSPGLDAKLVQQAQSNNVQMIPGVMTPTEIMEAENQGLETVKLFPASLAGGADFIRSMASVFPGMSFFPTGGITEDNINDYLNMPNVLCAGGTWLSPIPLLQKGDWNRIHEIALRC